MPLDETFSHPDRAEDIHPEWLSEVLTAYIPGVEVARVEVLDQHSGTTGRARLGLSYASGASGPAKIFVKLPPFGEEQRKLVASTDMGRKEARFHAHLADEVPLRVPRPLFAAYGSERTQYIMLLEDLEASGCVFTRKTPEYAQEHGLRVIENLARLHAHFWEDERFPTALSWLKPPMRGKLGAKLMLSAKEQFGADFPAEFSELCSLYAENQDAICDLWDEGEATMIHGDIHSGNQFLDGDQVGFYGWAVISRAPGARDLGIFLCNSCPPEITRSDGERWLRRYREILIESGAAAPDFETLWRRFRRTVLYGFTAAVTTAAVGERWQPLSVSLPASRRATEICRDLGTIEAFREAL
jgi:hypothetical protein